MRKLNTNLCIAGYIFVLMMLCVRSTPLGSTSGVDSSVFITMGRALLSGKVIYKDVFDHKGLYIYFINAFAALLTGKSTFGLFIIECGFMMLCAKLVYELIAKHTDNLSAFIGMQIFMMIALKYSLLEGGNLTEEYAMTLQVCSIYLLERDNNRNSCTMMMLQGILAGVVLCLRPNMIMMWGGIALVSGVNMLRTKNFGRLLGNIAAGLGGFIIALLPVVIYALLNDAVNDTLFGMFGYNLMYISTGAGTSSLMSKAVIVVNSMNDILLVCLLLSSLIMIFKHRKSLRAAYYFTMLAFSVASVSLSGRTYGHYYMYLVPFCLPLAYEAASLIPNTMHKQAVISVCLLSVIFGLGFIPDSIRLKFGKLVIPSEQYIKHNAPYYSADERVLVTDNHAILYNILGVIPHEKYFYIPSNNYDSFPEPIDSQIASIISGVNDVVIIWYREGEHEIYPQSGRSDEVKNALDSMYELLYHDERNDAFMYGRKRN